jgi:hypothetical protein
MFKKIGAVLTRRTTAAPKPAPELESPPVFKAHLLARGLSAEEATHVMVDRAIAGLLYWRTKGYTDEQIEGGMPMSQWFAIPTREADIKLYWEGYRRSKEFRHFLPRDFTLG